MYVKQRKIIFFNNVGFFCFLNYNNENYLVKQNSNICECLTADCTLNKTVSRSFQVRPIFSEVSILLKMGRTFMKVVFFCSFDALYGVFGPKVD